MVDCSLKSTTVLKRVCLPSDVVGLGTDIVFILNSFNPFTSSARQRGVGGVGGWTVVGGKWVQYEQKGERGVVFTLSALSFSPKPQH